LISPYKIKFRHKTNVDFDLIVGATFDSDHGSVESFLNKESTTSNTYDGSRRNVHGYHYTDVINVSFTLIKRDYTDITDDERRKIYAWLTGSNKVEELTIYKDDSEVVSYRLIGGFTSIEHYKMGNGRDVGVVVNFEHIAPYAYSPVKTITKSVTTPETFILNCRTDAYETKLYPRLTVKIGESIYLPVTEDPSDPNFQILDNTIYEYHYDVTNSATGKVTHHTTLYVKVDGGVRALSGVFDEGMDKQQIDSAQYVDAYYLCNADKYIYKGAFNDSGHYWQKLIKVGAGFEIKNTYFDGDMDITVRSIVTNCYTPEVITLDGDNKIISSSDSSIPYIRVFGDSFNWEWIYLVPGKNHITISGQCDVIIEWVEPIKIGNM
jgi:hypothetical protein